MSRLDSGLPGFSLDSPGYTDQYVDLPPEIKEVLSAEELAGVARTQHPLSESFLASMVGAEPIGIFALIALIIWLCKRLINLGHKPTPTITA